MTIIELLQCSYWPEHALTLKPQSLDQLRYSVGHFSEHLGHEATIDDFDKLKLIGLMVSRKSQVAAATVNKDRRDLLCLWRHAADNGFCSAPPRIPKCPEPFNEPHTFTIEELTRILEATKRMPDPTWWRSVVLFLYDSGARISASLAVNVSDVDFNERTVRLVSHNAKTLRWQTATLSDDALEAMKAQAIGREARETLWPWRRNRRQLFPWFRRLTVLAGIALPRGKCFHSLRRTHGTAVCELFGLEAASQSLGHTNTQTTKLYVARDRLTVLRVADRLPRPGR